MASGAAADRGMSMCTPDQDDEQGGARREVVLDDDGRGRLELRWTGDRPGTGVRLEAGSIVAQLHGGRLSRRQPLGRALGGTAELVVDATAGLGEDTLRLACFGARVIAIERSPLLRRLLEDGLNHLVRRDAAAGGSPLPGGNMGPLAAAASRIDVVGGDARTVLETIEPQPDVVYIDPMFPPKRRASALPPKPMQLLRALVGSDPDAPELLEVARRVALRRVIVKRPDHAPPLAAGAVASHGGKLVRYDVYLPVRPVAVGG